MLCSSGFELYSRWVPLIVVVVVGGDTYYWVNLSSDHPFQVYFKVRQLNILLQIAMVCYYKVRQLFTTKCDECYYKVQQVLQSATSVITKCDRTSLYTTVIEKKS